MYERVQGTKLALPSVHARPADRDTLGKMRRAFRSAKRGMVGGRELSPGLIASPGRDLLRDLRMDGNFGGAHAVRAAFYLGLQERKSGTRRERDLHGVLAQQELVQAILGMNANERHLLHAEGHGMGIGDAHEWRAIYSGAMAVARVSYVLMRLGVEAWLPPMGLDLHDKIDLIAYDGMWIGLCIQVKNHNLTGTTVCRLMRHDTPEAAREKDPYLRKFLDGVRAYARDTSGQWQGLFLRLGSMGQHPSELEYCDAVQRPILECVMGHFPTCAARVRTIGLAT
jgi:hypothetical protein